MPILGTGLCACLEAELDGCTEDELTGEAWELGGVDLGRILKKKKKNMLW